VGCTDTRDRYYKKSKMHIQKPSDPRMTTASYAKYGLIS
jgi:hypothetical protein